MLQIIVNKYRALMANADPRHADWPLMESPFPTIAICLFYVFTVKVWGPKFMENRKPMNLRNVMIFYNFAMVAFCAFNVYMSTTNDWFNDYSWTCQPVDYSTSPRAMLTLKLSYTYYILKFVEFLDTIFFVLRKKNSQISTLHVIHHGIMPFSVWWGLKFVPGGHATFFGYINTIVHVVMYTYYGLAAIGPQVQKYLWWKKYLTAFQMVQFVMIFLHSMQLFFRSCEFPKIFAVWIGAHGVLFWFLFSAFYRREYLSDNNKKSKSVSAFDSTCFLNGEVKLRDVNDNNKLNGRKYE